MNSSELNLKIFSILNIQKAETRKLAYFAVLQFMISFIIGILTGTVDSLFITHKLLPIEESILKTLFHALPSGTNEMGMLSTMLQALGGLILVITGVFFAGYTDRKNKGQLFSRFSRLTGLFFLVSFLLSLANETFFPIPFLYSFFYSIRFVSGVFLTVLFWDLAGSYFDHRQGKRIYGYIMMSGAGGYAIGTASIGIISLFLPVYYSFIPAVILSILCLIHFSTIRHSFTPVLAPQYKHGFSKNEAFEGLMDFFKQPVLFYILLSTLLFGLISGLIMTSYNNLIFVRYASRATGIMSIWRSVATILEAVIMTQILGQVTLGKEMKNGFVLQWVFLILGIVGFLVSMIGIADFTRQIETALFAPATITLFSAISGKKRGRAISVNSMIIAPAGMLLSPVIFIIFNAIHIPQAVLFVILCLVILRFFFAYKTNKHYHRHMAKKITNDAVNLSGGIENSIDAALSSENYLISLMEKSSFQNQKIKTALWQQLSIKVGNATAFKILKNYVPDAKSPALPYFFVLACKFDFLEYRKDIEKLIVEVPIWNISELYLTYLRTLKDHDEKSYLQQLSGLEQNICIRDDERSTQAWYNIWFALYDSTSFSLFERFWQNTTDHDYILAAMEKNLHEDFKKFLYESLPNEKDPYKLTPLIASLSPIDVDSLQALYRHSPRHDVRMSILKILSTDSRDKTHHLICSLFMETSSKFTLNEDFSPSALLNCYYKQPKYIYKEFIYIMKIVSSFSAPITDKIMKNANLLVDQTEAFIATLFWSWHQKRPGQMDLFALAKKIVDEDIASAVKLYFALCCIECYKPVDSAVITNTLGLLENESMDVTLKLIDASNLLLLGKRKNFLHAVLDQISPAEKLIRLQPSVPDSSFSFQELRNFWKSLDENRLGPVRSKIVINL